MSYRPKHLGHVNLYVRNAEKSRQWYEDVLGLHTYHSVLAALPSCQQTRRSRTRSR